MRFLSALVETTLDRAPILVLAHSPLIAPIKRLSASVLELDQDRQQPLRISRPLADIKAPRVS